MRRWGIAVWIGLCAFGLIAERGDSAETVRSAYVKGRDFADFPEARQRAYVMGLADGFHFAPVLCMGILEQLEPCLGGMSDVEMAALLNEFVRDHPDRSHESSNTLMYAALVEKCLKTEEPR